MTSKEWKTMILNTKDPQSLNELVEHMAFCDDITNMEYCELYNLALTTYTNLLENEF